MKNAGPTEYGRCYSRIAANKKTNSPVFTGINMQHSVPLVAV